MTNILQAETRKLSAEYSTGSFECGKLGSAELETIAMLRRSREALEELEHSRREIDCRELERKAALAEQVAGLLEALKATYSALLDETSMGVRVAEKRMAALAIAKARLTRELPTKGSPIAVSDEGRCLC